LDSATQAQLFADAVTLAPGTGRRPTDAAPVDRAPPVDQPERNPLDRAALEREVSEFTSRRLTQGPAEAPPRESHAMPRREQFLSRRSDVAPTPGQPASSGAPEQSGANARMALRDRLLRRDIPR
jgi:hypothetical protein